jgi:outer membrane protein OmpA-like peptidoglycan-associated protein
MKKTLIFVLIALVLVSSASCSSWSRKQKGAATGAVVGGVVGGVIGKQAGNTAVGAILGAAVGGATGAWIGSYMDKQAAEIEQDIQGARVERVGEGIKITFDSGLLFEIDKAALNDRSRTELAELAVILNKYPDTHILLEGHTDSQGTEEYNLELSSKRSQSVANHLSEQQVMVTRFTIMGYGESQPIATNETVDGRTLNRRVEVAIYANDKLKKIAEDKVVER